MARLLALQSHTTHDAHGERVEHPEGSTYELDDEGVIETLTALGFARRDEGAPTTAPPDHDHTRMTTGPEPTAPPPPAKPKRK